MHQAGFDFDFKFEFELEFEFSLLSLDSHKRCSINHQLGRVLLVQLIGINRSQRSLWHTFPCSGATSTAPALADYQWELLDKCSESAINWQLRPTPKMFTNNTLYIKYFDELWYTLLS